MKRKKKKEAARDMWEDGGDVQNRCGEQALYPLKLLQFSFCFVSVMFFFPR